MPKPVKCLNGNALKMIAVITMLIDHTAVVLIENSLLLQRGSAEAQAMWSVVDKVMRGVGRVAFPIFCYLLVEGFLHTRSVRKYALRLLIFAFISEVPFDLAVVDTWFCPQYQNVYVTLFLGLLAIAGLRRFQEEDSLWKQGLVVAVCCGAAWLLKSDYGAFGVFFICMLFLLYDDPWRQTILGSISLLWEPAAVLAFIPIRMYDGTRGKGSWKWFFYVFYPAHLMALVWIKACM